MPSLLLGPETRLYLYPGIFGQAYLEWVDAMLAAPSEELYLTAPAYGSTVWDDGEWCLTVNGSGYDSGDQSYLSQLVEIRAPLTGTMGQRFRDLVARHLTETPEYHYIQRLSEVRERRAYLCTPHLIVDQLLEVAWIRYCESLVGEGPLAEVVIDRDQDRDCYEYLSPLRATRLLVTHQSSGVVEAPMVVYTPPTGRTSNIQIRGDHCVLLYVSLESLTHPPQCRLLTLVSDQPCQHYQPAPDGGWVPLSGDPELDGLLLFPGLESVQSEQLVTIDQEAGPEWTEVMAPVPETFGFSSNPRQLRFWRRLPSAELS